MSNTKPGQEELGEVRKRLRALQRQCARLRRSGPPGQRCLPASPECLLVYMYSERCVETAADYVAGRGWWRGCHSALAGAERQEVVASVQRACSNTPAHTLVAMQENPVPCCSDRVVLAIVRYIVEHRLHTWVGQQNAVQGPSRAQLIDQALALVPSSVPDMIRKKVVAACKFCPEPAPVVGQV